MKNKKLISGRKLNIMRRKKLKIKRSLVNSGLRTRRVMTVITIQIPSLLLPVAGRSIHQRKLTNLIWEVPRLQQNLRILENKLNPE